MKRLLSLLVLLLVVSACEQKTKSFHGFGGLDIGADFKSLPNAKDFTQIMEDEYNIARYKLSDEIGVVSNLNISTENGKISEVRFVSTDETHTATIEKVTQQLVRINTKTPIKLDFIDFYNSADKKIFFVREKGQGLKSGNAGNQTKYSYFDEKAIIRNGDIIQRNIGMKPASAQK
ncbi:hypothetical protein [Flavobacterium silvaticum]|uniref:Uncharacterized protein n=1 Tax=Flavobacterium silvaticum TaxID=1852020 RepID=A0A972FR55_9FLAO|nr:hypothetical protein [Flavobacterium silvaticum]NMH27844.1 hypothetical protein [Flavobacterium silvaticum]